MEEATTSSALYGGERGMGGKFRKPPARKPPATPYDRPPVNQSQTTQRRDGGWLSKLVDPACRLISGGATRIFPSFFSKQSPTDALPPSNTEDHDKRRTEVTQDAGDDDERCTLNLEISRSTGVAGPSEAADRSKGGSDFDELRRDKIGNLSDDSGLSEIEQLVKEKNFSRDEINRLTEILQSRVIDLSNVEWEKENPSMTAGREAAGAVAAQENRRMSIEEKQKDLNRDIWGTSTPHLQSTMRDEVGPSPIEIAKAYMGTRTSEIGLGSKSIISTDKRALLHNDEFASKPFIPSPSPKSSICWPGAIVQDQCGYLTPQSQRGRFGLHNFPRTPYSRTLYSKSKSKLAQLQGDSNGSPNISLTPLQPSRTPIYEQVKSRSDVLDDGYGSVGPIRRIRHKFASETPSRGYVAFRSSQNAPSMVENSTVSKGFLPAFKNLEPGSTSSTSKFQSVDSKKHSFEVGVPTVHPQSSQMARKILEHLDRNITTPKEKSAELKLATEWKKPPTSEVTAITPNEQIGLPHSGAFGSRKNINLVNQKFSAQGNEDRGNSLFRDQPQEGSTNGATDAVKKNTSAPNIVFGNSGMIHGGNAGPSFDFKKTHDSQIKSSHEKAFVGFDDGSRKEKNHFWPLYNQINGPDVSKMVPNATGSEVLNLQKKPPSHSSGNKRVLASISIDKPDPRRTALSDNSYGFTFPVSASSGPFSEPPTPSIIPSLSASGLPQPKEGLAVPSYSFGSKRSTPPLIFSFPSTSSASTHDDTSDLKFNFGSDKKTRVSFRSVEKDAICY